MDTYRSIFTFDALLHAPDSADETFFDNVSERITKVDVFERNFTPIFTPTRNLRDFEFRFVSHFTSCHTRRDVKLA